MSTICLPANPDVSGVGVRTAIYAQNFLSFIPAFYALSDGKVTVDELDSIEVQSSTILITALAILVSALVEGVTNELSNIHAAIILNLSWMNNTNLFIYFLLYLHHTAATSTAGDAALSWPFWRKEIGELFGWALAMPKYVMPEANERLRWGRGQPGGLYKMFRWEKSRDKSQERKSPGSFVLFLGVIHLTLMAGVGLWLWSNPSGFGSLANRRKCEVPPSLIILGHTIPITSRILRGVSIFMYSLVLVPLFNIFIPMVLVILFYTQFNKKYPRLPPTKKNTFFIGIIALFSLQSPFGDLDPKKCRIFPISVCLLLLAIINVLFAIDTEVTLHQNRSLQDMGESAWTFGQTLAILLLLIPLRDVLETFIKRRGGKVQERIDKAHEATSQLHQVIEIGDLPMVQRLIEDGAQVDLKDKNGITPLHKAISKGSYKIVEYLGDKGAQLDLEDDAGKSPICRAAYRGHFDIVQYLGDKGAQLDQPDAEGITPLHAAVSQGNIALVKYFIDHGAHFDHPDKNGKTPLHEAAYWNYSDMVAFLVDKGAQLDWQDNNGKTPLHEAAYWGHSHIVNYLRSKGAQLAIKDKGGRTPFLVAASRGHANVMACLLQQEALSSITNTR